MVHLESSRRRSSYSAMCSQIRIAAAVICDRQGRVPFVRRPGTTPSCSQEARSIRTRMPASSLARTTHSVNPGENSASPCRVRFISWHNSTNSKNAIQPSHLGAMPMQTNSWITRSLGVLAVVVAAAFAIGSAWADGYQRGGIVPIAGCATFRGFYVGGNIGWAMLTAHQNDLDGFTSPMLLQPASFTATDDGFTAGAQVGYNLQKGCTVFGIEADWTWADLNADTRLFPH